MNASGMDKLYELHKWTGCNCHHMDILFFGCVFGSILWTVLQPCFITGTKHLENFSAPSYIVETEGSARVDLSS